MSLFLLCARGIVHGNYSRQMSMMVPVENATAGLEVEQFDRVYGVSLCLLNIKWFQHHSSF